MVRSKNQNFTIIYWNIWERTQLTPQKLTILTDQLEQLVTKYQPDAFGLTEVLYDTRTQRAPVLEFLKKHGYQVHFTEFSPHKEHYIFGCALVSKAKPERVADVLLGPNRTAAVRGYKGHTVSMITSTLPLTGGGKIHVLVAHLAHLALYNMTGTHQKHLRVFRQVLGDNAHQTMTIAGGDLNEPALWPKLWRDKKAFHHRGGRWGKPTWTHHGRKFTPLRASYDHVLWSADGSLVLKTFEVLDRTPSDHAPLLAVFEVN